MNTLYDSARQSFLTGQIDWTSSDARLLLISAGYGFNPADQVLDDIDPSFIIANEDIPNESGTDGYAFGGQTAFLSLSSPQEVVAAVIYINDGSSATSPLIAFYDTVIGFPFTPQGLDYFISPDVVFGGFFRL